MANNKRGRSGERRLADMTIQPPPDVYRPPSCPPAEEFPYPAELATGHVLYFRPRIYRGKTVDFALQQMMQLEDEDEWVQVARIDCCHSMVHRHQFNRAGVDVFDHRVIQAIPKDGWDVVNAAFDPAIDVMLEEWEDNVRRWRHG